MKRSHWFLGGLLGLAGLAATAYYLADAPSKTLVFCSEDSPESFNPQINTTSTSFDASLPIYSGLLQFARGATTVEPALSESLDISQDGTEIVFHLRRGVKFHSNEIFTPTRDFNADDVLFSFNRQWKQDHPFHNVSEGRYDYFNDMNMPDLLKSIEKLDDYTVKFTLFHPEAPILANLAMPFASILSAEYGDVLQKKGTLDLIDMKPIGTGPFQFVSYSPGKNIRYKAFGDFWGGRQKLDRLEFSITPDASVRRDRLVRDECQVMAYPDPEDVKEMRLNSALNVTEREGMNVAFLAMNVSKQPFDDIRVRQAMNMAINKKALVASLYQGMGVVAKNPIPPTMWSYNDDIVDYPYNPTKAMELLAEAGYRKGFETTLWAIPVSRPYMPDGHKAAEIIKADLAEVGVRVEIVSYEWAEYRRRLQDGEAIVAQDGWTGDNGDPDNFLNMLLGCTAAREGGNNSAKWCNKDFDALITKAARTTDIEERTRLYKEAQVIFKQQAPWVTLAHSIIVAPKSARVKNYVIDPFGLHSFQDVWLED